MYVLGISFLSDCGIALVRDGNLLEAVNEERFSRIKLHQGVPNNCLKYIFSKYGLNWNDIDYVATHGAFNDEEKHFSFFKEKEKEIIESDLRENKEDQLIRLWTRYAHEKYVRDIRTPNYIRQINQYKDNLKIYPHHLCHAIAAYQKANINEAYVLTIDGWGEDGSALFAYAENDEISIIDYSPTFCSLGYLYGSITKFLGFKPHQHEGKILGLSAHGNRDTVYPIISKMVKYNRDKKRFDGLYELGLYIANYNNPNLIVLDGNRREDIAAAVQRVLEETVLDFVNDRIIEPVSLCVAGGIFANVLLNQRIVDETNIKGLYVYPQMGDGGLAVGAAMLCYKEITDNKIVFPKTIYLGSEYSNEDIERTLKEYNVSYKWYNDIEEEVARLLADGNVVARFNGKMEYGPRALGNRSILYKADDRTVNDWLNKKLCRTEFMPFAPVTLHEVAYQYYIDIDKYAPNTDYMTITVNCTDYMKKHCSGCVHVDGTARPQLIRYDQNPSYYMILKKYYDKTSIATLINTSFNMHEEPIVESPSDAMRALFDSGLPYLAIGNYLVINSVKK